VSQVGYGPGALVVLGAEIAPADLGKMLIAAGWPDATPFAITWDGTTTEQQTVATTLGRIGPDLKAAGVTVATGAQHIAPTSSPPAETKRLTVSFHD